MHSAARSAFLPVLVALLASSGFAAPDGPKLKPEEVVAKHLDSIGTAEARAAVTSRLATGTTKMTVIAGGTGEMQGGATLLSNGRQLQIHLPFKHPNYVGEFYEFDGKKYSDAQVNPNVRSRLGAFVHAQSQMVEEGLLGGVLTTAWALLDAPGRQARMSYDGLKKVGGKELHQLTYRMKKGSSDLSVQIYFEPETFRHVMTIYRLTQRAPQGPTETESARQQETRYYLEENFSDFSTTDGVTLPTHWKLKFTSEFTGQGVPQSSTQSVSQSSILEWDVVLQKIVNNSPVARSEFNTPSKP
jgi:hypothetical protein